MTDTLVGRLRDPVAAWLDTKPRDDLDLSAFIEWLKVAGAEAAAEIERQGRIIDAHQQQIIDGQRQLAEKDAEIERLTRRIALLEKEISAKEGDANGTD